MSRSSFDRQNPSSRFGALRRRQVPVAGLAAAALALGGAALANADVVNSVYIASNLYDYKNLHMPDLDQRRSALPNDGAMYCVPTAAMNLFIYAANHGFPDFGPSPGNWQSNFYIQASLWLVLMGDWMNTDPVDGTGGSGTRAGLDEMLESAPYLKRVHKGRSSSFTPSAHKLAHYACSGWMMSFVYGKYQQVGTQSGLPVLDRVGGHAVTLTRLYRVGDDWILRYRDPADDSASLSTQSTFKNTSRSPWTLTAFYGGTSFENLRAMTAIFSTSGGTRVIDVLYGIRPLFGITFANTGDSGGGGTLEVIDPIPFEGTPSSELSSFSISPFVDVLDVDFDPDFQDAMIISKSNVLVSPARLRRLSLIDGSITTLTPSPNNVVRFATSRLGHIFAFDTSDTLHKLLDDGTPIADTTAIPEPTDVAVQDGDDSVWVLSVPDRKLVKLFNDFSETLLTINVPTSVPMLGDGELRIHPETGTPWFVTDANDTMYGLKMEATGALTVHTFASPALAQVDSFSFGDDAELFVTGDGSVKVLSPTSDTSWAINPSHPFHGQPGGTHLAMLRSTDNYDEVEHSGPEWRNLTLAELEENGPFVGDCASDLNGDDMVDGADVGLLLAAWGSTAGGLPDIDQNGVVDGGDLGLLLGEWGFCE